MKTKFIFFAFVLTMAQSAFAEEKVTCPTDIFEEPSNPIIALITIPFKLPAVLTFGPRCLIANIPKNEK
ncbi:MAG: hypothetical protein K0U15_04865 [Proteobacteria bacterium]|nr:hypothetical protein [Pseudomonadota bacterium]